jgi:hypothetical protein
MGVSSKCTIARTIGKSAYAPEVPSGWGRTQNGDKTQNHKHNI